MTENVSNTSDDNLSVQQQAFNIDIIVRCILSHCDIQTICSLRLCNKFIRNISLCTHTLLNNNNLQLYIKHIHQIDNILFTLQHNATALNLLYTIKFKHNISDECIIQLLQQLQNSPISIERLVYNHVNTVQLVTMLNTSIPNLKSLTLEVSNQAIINALHNLSNMRELDISVPTFNRLTLDNRIQQLSNLHSISLLHNIIFVDNSFELLTQQSLIKLHCMLNKPNEQLDILTQSNAANTLISLVLYNVNDVSHNSIENLFLLTNLKYLCIESNIKDIDISVLSTLINVTELHKLAIHNECWSFDNLLQHIDIQQLQYCTYLSCRIDSIETLQYILDNCALLTDIKVYSNSFDSGSIIRSFTEQYYYMNNPLSNRHITQIYKFQYITQF